MLFLKKIILFIKKLLSEIEGSEDSSTLEDNQNEKVSNKTPDSIIQEESFLLNKDFAFVEKNNIIDRINSLRTKLSRIEFVCKDEFLDFSNKLDILEAACQEEYKKYSEALTQNKLTFTCDPKFNDDIIRELIDIQNQIENFINQIGKYKILQERLEKLHQKLLTFYDEYKKGCFKGDFNKLIEEAKVTLNDVIKRVLGNEPVLLNTSQDFLDKNSLNDTYNSVLYLITKCEIYYMIVNNNFSTSKIKESFKENFLIFLMKDLESMKNYIKTLEGTIYYTDLIEKLQKLKSVNISDIEEVLNSKSFFEDFVGIEDAIIKTNKKIASDDIKRNTNNILNILNA